MSGYFRCNFCSDLTDLSNNLASFILKISTSIERLNRERKANDLLHDYLPVSKSILFITDDQYTYYLKTKLLL